MAKKPTPPKRTMVMPVPRPPASSSFLNPSPRLAPTVPRVITPADRIPFDSSAYRGAAGLVGVPAVVRPATSPASMYRQNSTQMRAAGAAGLGQRTTPMVRGDGGGAFNQMVRNNLVNQARIENALGAPSTIPANLAATLPAAFRPAVPAPAATPFSRTPVAPAAPTRPAGGGGSTGGGGGVAAGAGGASSFQTILDAISGAYNQQRAALGSQLDALIAAQGNRRTAADAAQAAAAQQLAGILSDLQSGATRAGEAVGGVYSQADTRLGQLMNEYQQMAAQRAAGGGQTLAAFGAEASLAQPGGMTAADYLAAERAALGSLGAGEQAYWAGRPQVYQGLASDINTQRTLQYEALMRDIANQEQQARADIAQQQAQVTAAEQEALLDAQLQAWAAAQNTAGRSGSGGATGAASFMPIPDVFSLGV